jgi:hypothetical protein
MINTHTSALLNMREIRHGMGENWYSHIHKAVCERENITVLWSEVVQRDRELVANKSDIITENKADKVCLLIEEAVPSGRNLI